MTKKITLRPGDYVRRADIHSEEQYHAVGEAFIAAGAPSGEFPDYEDCQACRLFGWCSRDGLFHTPVRDEIVPGGNGHRKLTPDEILGAAPEQQPSLDPASDRWHDYMRASLSGGCDAETAAYFADVALDGFKARFE